MINVLHPAAFIENNAPCPGAYYTREQPSRETPGVLLNDVTDKYVTEFTVPFRNVVRTIKELQINWARISDQDRQNIIGMFNNMGICTTTSPLELNLKSNPKSKSKRMKEHFDMNNIEMSNELIIGITITLFFVVFLIIYYIYNR